MKKQQFSPHINTFIEKNEAKSKEKELMKKTELYKYSSICKKRHQPEDDIR